MLRDYSKKKTSILLQIELTISVEECLEYYFQTLIEPIEERMHYYEMRKTLDYRLMRRFLETAFKSLKELDNAFFSKDLLDLKKDLVYTNSLYEEFRKKTSLPEQLYEQIFLRKQEEYKKTKEKTDRNTLEIGSLDTYCKTISSKINDAKALIEGLNTNSPDYKKYSSELKTLKTREADYLHKLFNLKEETAHLKLVVKTFERTHLRDFKEVLEEYVNELTPEFLSVINSQAYVYDKELWKKARESKHIKKYFENTNITGTLSSRTYLKYFIKNIDRNKAMGANKELFGLLEYLESNEKIKIVIVSDDIRHSAWCKKEILNIKQEYVALTNPNIKKVLAYCIKNIPDIIILDSSLKKTMDVKSFLEQYRDNIPQGSKYDSLILLLAQSLDNKEEALADEIEANALIKKDFNINELRDTILELEEELEEEEEEEEKAQEREEVIEEQESGTSKGFRFV